ncbi:beta-phosphoglucomutase [Ligilactobacillus salitolerans]|uniref:Beta-phosphoglucomutase n=1 Tax=Ligilactobacillus salitolerans TaxID=1808352 RepID=A0A401IRQ1_9LACO|nr:HAD family phosphatase [Ligilactobacillus salitolerans]GBG94196.1 beta-phosphoglucomutase [Ligilactobacillus salitolerans]
MKAFVFDMDGVLVDSERYFFQLKRQFLHEIGERPAVDNVTEVVGLSADSGWAKFVPQDDKRSKLRPLYEEYKKEHLIDYTKYLNADVPEFLADLKADGQVIALASAGYLSNIKQMLRQCELDHYFSSVMSGEHLKANKPAPDIYLQSAQKLGFSPAECVAVEDSPVGIQAAKSAGLETWAVKYPYYQLDQHQADRVFRGFGAMRDFYQKLR